MNITDLLSPDGVMVDVAAPDKHKLLWHLARKAGAIVDLVPECLYAELHKRENLGSTGVGGGVAIPHARFQQLTRPVGMLLRLRRPIEFEAVDGAPVDLVSLILLPENPEAEQLSALALIARKLRNPKIAMGLRGARDSGEMYRVLTT